MTHKEHPTITTDHETPKSPTQPEPSQPSCITQTIEHIRVVGYEVFIDPLLEKVRKQIADFIPHGSRVIDIGCGSGALAFHLAKNKDCTVQGVDMATGKITRANDRKSKTNSKKVQFSEADATNLRELEDQKFDYATMSLFVHALPENIRNQVIKEAMRVAKRLIIADYTATQPVSLPGMAVRGIERIAGNEHFHNFNSYRANGGLDPLLAELGLKTTQDLTNPSDTIRIVVAEAEN